MGGGGWGGLGGGGGGWPEPVKHVVARAHPVWGEAGLRGQAEEGCSLSEKLKN